MKFPVGFGKIRTEDRALLFKKAAFVMQITFNLFIPAIPSKCDSQ